MPAWIQPFIPDPALAAALAPLSLLYAWAAARWAGHLRVRREVRAPYTRKIFHFTIFTAASVIQAVFGVAGTVVFGSVVALVVLHAVWRRDGYPFYEALARPTDAPHRTLFILIPLLTTALGGVLANILTGQFALVGYLVGGWGDAVGEPVGTRWGKHRYKVPSLAGVPATRSLEGSAAVLLVGAAAAFLGLTLGLGVAAGTAAWVALACGAAGAAVEAFSSHGLDNLTVQVTGAVVAWWLLSGAV